MRFSLTSDLSINIVGKSLRLRNPPPLHLSPSLLPPSLSSPSRAAYVLRNLSITYVFFVIFLPLDVLPLDSIEGRLCIVRNISITCGIFVLFSSLSSRPLVPSLLSPSRVAYLGRNVSIAYVFLYIFPLSGRPLIPSLLYPSRTAYVVHNLSIAYVFFLYFSSLSSRPLIPSYLTRETLM